MTRATTRWSGDVGNDTLLGGDGNDDLSGGDGNDDLKGEAGNDTIDGGPGTDRQTGGPHVDTLLYSPRSAGVTVTLIGKARKRRGQGERLHQQRRRERHDGRGGDTIDADDNCAARSSAAPAPTS